MSKAILIPKPDIRMMEIETVGLTPFISHRFSAKNRKEIADKQEHKAKRAKGKRNPEQEFKDSLYEIAPNKYGIPAAMFKGCAVGACSFTSGITKVIARGSFFVIGDNGGELIAIKGSKPKMRTDDIRLNGKIGGLAYRAMFETWKCKLTIRYNASVISPEQIANLLEIGGFSIGVGDWRPQRNGTFGMFTIAGGKANDESESATSR